MSGANFTKNSKFISLDIPIKLISIKDDITKLKKMPRVVRSKLMKNYKRLEMNKKLEINEMRGSNGSYINKLRENLIELGKIFKEYWLKKKQEEGTWNTTNTKKMLIEEIFKKITITIQHIDKQLKAEEKQRRNTAAARRFNAQFPKEPYNKNLTGKKLHLRYENLYNPEAQPPPSYGGSLFVNVKGVGKRKVRYYKNGNKYVLAKGKKKKI